eukprot:tig00000808_g4435.t1
MAEDQAAAAPDDPATAVAAAAPLPYFDIAYRELDAEDGLLVMGKGLGIERILLAFVRTHCSPTSLAFLVHVPPRLEAWMRNELQADGVPAHLLPRVVNNDFDANERLELYRAGGCLLVTSRIFIVDLLSKRIPAERITGMLVNDAHRVTESSGEAFILRLYRQSNRTGFIKAFSDCPDSLCGGFSGVERVMKALYVRRLYLWPRYQLRVMEALEARQPEVVELLQPMTPAMHAIQLALVEVMEGCLAELRRTVHVDVEKLTLQNALFRSFDLAVRQQLDPVWHTTSAKTKQLVADLRTLRRLLAYVARYDAVTFHAYLETLRQTEGIRAAWLFLDSAQKIFRTAQQRVFLLRRVGPGAVGSGRGRGRGRGKAAAAAAAAAGPSGVAPEQTELATVLEENPKWALLGQVLAEIARDRAAPGAPPEVRADAPAASPVLVLAKDERTCTQLAEYLTAGGAAMMTRIFQRWAIRKRSEGAPQGPQQQQQHGGGGGGAWGRGQGRGGPGGAGGAGPSGPRQRTREEELLIAHAEKLRRAAWARERERGEAEGQPRGGGFGWSRRPPHPPPRKKPRSLAEAPRSPRGAGPAPAAPAPPLGPAGRGGAGRGKRRRSGAGAGREPRWEELEGFEGRAFAEAPAPDPDPDPDPLAGDGEEEEGEGEARRPGDPGGGPAAGAACGEDPYGDYAALPGRGMVVLQGLEGAAEALEELAPHYVVVYDPDLALTRRLEVFKASRPGRPLRVYFLLYETSVERQKYLSAVRREKDAFEALIRTKAHMSVPAEQDGRSGAADPAALAAANLLEAPAGPASTIEAANAVTRVAGGAPRPPPASRPAVVVDLREFRSSLPGILHARGFDVHPATLIVGDYVLAPDVVVERKSPSDLFQSLGSGRLYAQCEAMQRHYKTFLLLIEFEAGRAFGLQSAREIGPEILPSAVTSRVALLALHFPALRFLWSASPHATAALFQELKAARPEPDPDAAAAVGAADSAAAAAAAGEDGSGEARAGSSLQGLSRMSEREIAEVVGGKTAQTIHEFIHAPAPVAL